MRKPAMLVIGVLLGPAALGQEKAMTTFNFDSDGAGEPPKGFEFGLTGKGKPGSGKVDQGCGIVWRLKDANTSPSPPTPALRAGGCW
jgi:hypothetical protein